MQIADDKLGGRLPLIDPEAYTDAQRAFAERLGSTWVKVADKLGVMSKSGDGRLIGPFNPFLLHPELSESLSDLQEKEASQTSLDPGVREVVVIMTGAIWRADYELYAQRAVAGDKGLSVEQIEALAAGEIPDDLRHTEAIAACVAKDLMTHRRIDGLLYEQAERALGQQGLYDLLMVMGLYQVVCSMLALFEVPAPT